MSVAIFIAGPAGTGKTTFCFNLNQYFSSLNRKTCLFNLDPASIHGQWNFSIHEKWSVDKIAKKYNLGPNGSMMKCLELCANDPHWLDDKLSGYNNEILIVDCPGQIELYIHDDSMQKIINVFKKNDYNTCCTYLIDSTFILDKVKLHSAYLNMLSTMMKLSLPHLNVITKMDLISNQEREELADCVIQGTEDYTNGDKEYDKEYDKRDFKLKIQNLLNNYQTHSLLCFDQSKDDDYYIISSYIDRILEKDDDDYDH